MPKHATTEIIGTNVLNHPAVMAWSQLQPKRVKPEGIQILKHRKHKKSGVYRVIGVGPANVAISAGLAKDTLASDRLDFHEAAP